VTGWRPGSPFYEAWEQPEEADLEAEPEPEIVLDDDTLEDPVRIYLREIGRFKLLTAQDEKKLAKKMEEGRFLERLEGSFDCEASPEEMLASLLHHLVRHEDLFSALERLLPLPLEESLAQRLTDSVLRAAIDSDLNPDLVADLAALLEADVSTVSHEVIEFSLVTSVLPPAVLNWLNRTTPSMSAPSIGFTQLQAIAHQSGNSTCARGYARR
jgi:RNA polymerase primary sigma factor